MDYFKLLLLTLVIVSGSSSTDTRRFNEDFKFGTSTASYQVEGAWNVSDKGESIWDHAAHNTNYVKNGDTGDVACDSYHKYKRDVEMLVELGVDIYRFSISWPRILPTGFANVISKDGIAYYNNLINELLKHNITPSITLYHWDLPQNLQELGGWANPLMAKYFMQFSNVAFDMFGDRVKLWVTFNEPSLSCQLGYGEKHMSPALGMRGIAEYLCAHTIIKAHAQVYHLYNNSFKPTQKGKLSIVLKSAWHEPEFNTTEAKGLAETGLQFELGWFANPIFSLNGDYPSVMKDNVAKRSSAQGYPESRLPEFTSKEIRYVRGTYDFLGLNHYTTLITTKKQDVGKAQSFYDDSGVTETQDPNWTGSETKWLKVVPWGFRKLLNLIKERYGNPEVIIFENGVSDKGEHCDYKRIDYLNGYMNAMLDAIEDGCNVTGYMPWSLMDNFEWFEGYTQKYGLYSVDFNDHNRTRTPKSSASYFNSVIKNKTLKRYTEDVCRL